MTVCSFTKKFSRSFSYIVSLRTRLFEVVSMLLLYMFRANVFPNPSTRKDNKQSSHQPDPRREVVFLPPRNLCQVAIGRVSQSLIGLTVMGAQNIITGRSVPLPCVHSVLPCHLRAYRNMPRQGTGLHGNGHSFLPVHKVHGSKVTRLGYQYKNIQLFKATRSSRYRRRDFKHRMTFSTTGRRILIIHPAPSAV